MIRAGLISTHRAINYGAVLQAYSLRLKIEEYSEYCEVIDLMPSNKKNTGREFNYNFSSIKAILNSLYLFISVKNKIKIKRKIKKFDDFVNKNIVITKLKFVSFDDLYKNISNDYDCLVCGSDQIWNLNLFREPSYFLRFEKKLPNINYIAYAASITEKLTEEQYNYIKENIKHFSSISVREKQDVEIIQKLTNKTVEWVLDPVFLLSSKVWDDISEPVNKIKEPYLLLYTVAGNEEYRKVVMMLQKYFKYKVVCINTHLYNKYNADYLITDASPGNFIWLIKNAAFVCTSSFHAVAFSIIFNKQFIAVADKKRASRHVCILKEFNIEERLIFDSAQFNIGDIANIDYTKINDRLEILSQKSLSFLYTALKK